MAAVPRIYETLTIQFFDHASLERAVADICANPMRRHFLAHARRLSVIVPPVICRDFIDSAGGRATLSIPDSRDDTAELAHFLPGTLGPFLEPHLVQWRDRGLHSCLIKPDLYKERDREPNVYKEKNWEPLISLLSSLRELRDFHYVVANMFPKCLLDVIHDRHPSCRLSIWSWHRLSLHQPRFGGKPFSDDAALEDHMDIGLFQSPCLFSISMIYRAAIGSTTQENEREPIFDLLAKAPNVKHVQVRCRPQWPKKLLLASNQWWQGLIDSTGWVNSATPISLSLRSPSEEQGLLNWSRTADLSQLESLSLHRPRLMDLLVTVLPQLHNLRRFSINIDLRFDHRVRSLLLSLNPLHELHIRGLRLEDLIEQVLERHGATLRGLILEPPDNPTLPYPRYVGDTYFPVLEAEHILRWSELCPHLAELRIPFLRSMGDLRECRFYRALGHFSSLRSLVLDLDSSVYQLKKIGPWPPLAACKSNEFGIRNMLINAAMDEALASSIFHRILTAQGEQGQLLHLRVNVSGCHASYDFLRHIVWHVSRSFLVTRTDNSENANVSTGSDVHVREIGRKERDLLPERVAHYTGKPIPRIPKEVQEVMCSLWPASKDTDWRSSWHSFPLGEESDANSLT